MSNNFYSQHPHREHPALAYLNTARKAAHEIRRTYPGVEYKELEAIAFAALVELWDSYDPTRGLSISVYLLCRIKGKLLHYLRDNNSLIRKPRTEYDLCQRSRALERKLLAQGISPTLPELADRLGVTSEKLRDARLAMTTCRSMQPELTAYSLAYRHSPQVSYKSEIDSSSVNKIDKYIFVQIFKKHKKFPEVAKTLGITSGELLYRLRRYFKDARIQIIETDNAIAV